MEKVKKSLSNKELEKLLRLYAKEFDNKPKVNFEHTESCPDAETFAKFCGNELSDEEHKKIIEHIEQCKACCSDMVFYYKEIYPEEEREKRDKANK